LNPSGGPCTLLPISTRRRSSSCRRSCDSAAATRVCSLRSSACSLAKSACGEVAPGAGMSAGCSASGVVAGAGVVVDGAGSWVASGGLAVCWPAVSVLPLVGWSARLAGSPGRRARAARAGLGLSHAIVSARVTGERAADGPILAVRVVFMITVPGVRVRA
jgi:hypothetical protein